MARSIVWTGFLCMCLAMAGGARAAYPDRPISLIVVFGPGGTSDVVARIVAKELAAGLKQPVVVENRPGAGGNVGAAAAARAAPDGYTLLAAFPGLTTNGALYGSLNYDPAGFVPISLLASAPNVIVVRPSSTAATLREFVEQARAAGKPLNFGSAGAGTSSHLAGEAFKELAGIDMVHVPYKGGAPALADLAASRLDVMIIPLPESIAMIRAGKVKPLALASARRSPLLPELPTTAEAGWKNFEVGSWYGLSAPHGTPAAVRDALAAAAARALRAGEVQAAFAAQGVETVGSSPAEFDAFLKSETARWSAVIVKNDIHLD
ncbi:tripartite tricarboxylate transporter substrate binding protein [Pigmentiphaga soli]